MNNRSVTKEDLDAVESKLEKKIDAVENRLEKKIDAVDAKVEIVAQQVNQLTQQVNQLTQQVDRLTRESVTRADLAALREDLGRDMAQHIEAGFRMMQDQFGLHDDRAKAIEDTVARHHNDFTAHATDFVLHNKP